MINRKNYLGPVLRAIAAAQNLTCPGVAQRSRLPQARVNKIMAGADEPTGAEQAAIERALQIRFEDSRIGDLDRTLRSLRERPAYQMGDPWREKYRK